jgi:hypothetical protein
MPPDDEERLRLEATCRRIAGVIASSLPRRMRGKVGFSLFLYDFGEVGNLAYVSNGNRGDVIKMLNEFLAKVGD